MAVRSLVVVLVVAFLSWLGAASAILHAERQAAAERALLVRVVCEFVLILEQQGDPLAAIFRARYNALLAKVGESCPTERS